MNIVEIKKCDRSILVAELERAGAVFRGNTCKCPFHEDNHPSAGVFEDNEGNWRFKCQACGFSGDVWDVIAKVSNKPVGEVLREARRQNSSTGPRERGFNTLEELKAAIYGAIEAEYAYTNPTTGKVDFYVFRSKVSGTEKTFRPATPANSGFLMKMPPKPWPIYNRGRVQQADTVIVCEGEKCVHVLHEHKITATTNPGGAGKAEYCDWTPLAGKNVILWPDNDQPGKKHILQIEACLRRLNPEPRISIIEPSDLDLAKKEDVADYVEQLKTAGLDIQVELHKAIQRAKPKGVAASVEEQFERIIEGKYEAVLLPWPKTSKLTNAIIPGTITVICGSPGASKSFMLLQCIADWNKRGYKSCVYELELGREFHVIRALAQRTGIAGLTDPAWVKQNPEQARRAYSENRSFVELMGNSIWDTPDTQQTLEQLASWIKGRAEAGYRIIAIDPITYAVQTERPWIADNNFLQKVSNIAKDNNSSVVLVTHPTKTVSFPDMHQLAGSAAYARKARTVLWLQSHSEKASRVRFSTGTKETKHNRTLHILKATGGKGSGLSIACEFDSDTLTLKEYGIIGRD